MSNIASEPKKILFTKMHGAGNDFIIIDNRNKFLTNENIISLTPELCDRRFGIGADGLIALQPAKSSSLDYTMFYRNADGSDAGMCGNGARCLALLAAGQGLGNKLTFNVHDSIYRAEVKPENQVSIHFSMQLGVKKLQINENSVFQLNTGTEHIVAQVSAAVLNDKKYLIEKGTQLRRHNNFNPPGTNVNFICGISENTLRLQTYEKGVENLTLACGTGAIAAALVWHDIQKLPSSKYHTFIVETKGGTLQVGFTYNSTKQSYSNISLSGQACFVYRGTYEF